TGILNGRDEVKKFLALAESKQAHYQVMKWPRKKHDPALKLRDGGDGLLDRVERYGRTLDPRSGVGAASDFADRVDLCWRRGRSGDLKACLPDVDKPVEAATTSAAFAAALKLLGAYNDLDRPARLSHSIQSKEVTQPNADCGTTGHLPSNDESL